MYKKRKAYMEGMLGAESLKLDNVARFIMEKIEGKVKVENMKKKDVCKVLKSRNYDPDPVVAWKKKIAREMPYDGDDLIGGSQGSEASEEGEWSGLLNRRFLFLLFPLTGLFFIFYSGRYADKIELS